MPKLAVDQDSYFRSLGDNGGIEMDWSKDGTVVEIEIDRGEDARGGRYYSVRLTIGEADELRRMLNDHIEP